MTFVGLLCYDSLEREIEGEGEVSAPVRLSVVTKGHKQASVNRLMRRLLITCTHSLVTVTLDCTVLLMLSLTNDLHVWQ